MDDYDKAFVASLEAEFEPEAASLRIALAASEQRVRELTGPECKDAECPDYDGEHPFHENPAVKAWDRCMREHVKPAIARAEKAEADVRELEERYARAVKHDEESYALASERLERIGVLEGAIREVIQDADQSCVNHCAKWKDYGRHAPECWADTADALRAALSETKGPGGEK